MSWRQTSHFTGFILHSFSSWPLTSWVSDLSKVHPSCLHFTLGSSSRIFSTALFLVSVSWPLHTGQGFPSALRGSLHLWQSSWPLVQRNTGGSLMVWRHTGHSSFSATQSSKDTFAFRFFPAEAMALANNLSIDLKQITKFWVTTVKILKRVKIWRLFKIATLGQLAFSLGNKRYVRKSLENMCIKFWNIDLTRPSGNSLSGLLCWLVDSAKLFSLGAN